MKHIVFKILTVLMIVSIVACASTSDASASSTPASTPAPATSPAPTPVPAGPPVDLSFTPGTYRGTGMGFNGDTVVEVTVDATRILTITIVSHNDSEGYSDPGFARTPADIINRQTLNVDVKTGATYTSEGIRDAVADALEKSGVNMQDLRR